MRRKLFCALLIMFILLTMPQVNALESINEAIQNGVTNIFLDQDITENVVIPEGKKITINLNDKKISSLSGVTITNNGELTIIGNGEVVGSTSYALLNHGTTLTIKGGKYYFSDPENILVCNTSNGAYKSGPSLLSNGWYTASDNTKADTENPYSEMIIENGEFIGGLNTIKNDEYGKLTISGGTITNNDCTNSQDISNAVAILNGGKSMIINENPTINGVVTNQITGVDKERDLIITGGHIKQMGYNGINSSIIFDNIDIENVTFDNTFNISQNVNDLTLKNITAKQMTIGGKLMENGSFIMEKLTTPSMTYAINVNHDFENLDMNTLKVNSGSTTTINIKNSKINDVTIGQSTTCMIDNLEGNIINASSGTNVTLKNSKVTSAVASNAGKLTIIESSTDGLFAYGKNSLLTVTSGTHKDVYAGYNQSKKEVAGICNIIVDGGTFSGNVSASAKTNTTKSILTINDGDFTGNAFDSETYSGTIVVNGGTFLKDENLEVIKYIDTDHQSVQISDDKVSVALQEKIHDIKFIYINPDGEKFNEETKEYIEGMEYDFTNPVITVPEGWYLSETTSNAKGTLGSEDITIEIRYSNQYTLSFVTNSEEELAAITKTYGETVKLPDITREGYKFDGWYLDSELTNKVLEVVLKEDMKVYAKWLKHASLVIKYLDDDNNQLDIVTIDGCVDDAIEIPQKSFDNYYLVSDEISSYTLKDENNEVIIKYSNKYVLTYITNTSESIEPEKESYGKKIILKEITREGYKFDGWYLDNELTNKVSEVEIKEDTKVYAKWLKLYTITVEYVDENSNELANSDTYKFVEKESYKIEDISLTGYELKNKSANSEGTSLDSDITVIFTYKKIVEDSKESNNDQEKKTNSNTTTTVKTDTVINTQTTTNEVTEIIEDDKNINNIPEVIVKSDANSDSKEVSTEVKEMIENILAGSNDYGLSSTTKNKIIEAVNKNQSFEIQIAKKEVTEDEVREDALRVKNNLEDNIIAGYYDVTIILKTNNEYLDNITNLSHNIKLILPVPSNLPSVMEGYQREYIVYRVHNNIASKVNANINEQGMLEVDTKEFSTYAIAYHDIKIQDIPSNINSNQTNNKVLIICGITLAILIALITFVSMKRKRDY